MSRYAADCGTAPTDKRRKITVPMALVKFSATMAKVSQAAFMPDDRLPGEREIGEPLQHAAEPQACRQRKRAGQKAAGEAADQRRRQSYAFDDGGVFVARKSEIDHEWRGQCAGQRVGKFEQHDESQHGEGQVAGQKFREGAECRVTTRVSGLAPAAISPSCSASAPTDRSGSVGGKRGDDADDDQRGHGDIARAPGRPGVASRGAESR